MGLLLNAPREELRRAAGVVKAIQSAMGEIDPAFYAALANDDTEAAAMYERDKSRSGN